MIRTTTAFVAAAVAAALAAGPVASDVGSTAARWHDTTSVAGKSITAGALDIRTLTSSVYWRDNANPTTQSPIELNADNDDYVTLRSRADTTLRGTGLGAVLKIEYTWTKIYETTLLWNTGHVGSLGRSATVRIAGSADKQPEVQWNVGNGQLNASVSVLLWPANAGPAPASTPARPVITFSDANPSVEVDLRIANTNQRNSWAIGATGVPNQSNSEKGSLTASLRQFSGSATGPWTSEKKPGAILPVLYNSYATRASAPALSPNILETLTTPSTTQSHTGSITDQGEQPSKEEDDSGEISTGTELAPEVGDAEDSKSEGDNQEPDETESEHADDQEVDGSEVENMYSDATLECADLPDLLDRHDLEESDLAALPSSLSKQDKKTVTDLAEKCDAMPVAAQAESIGAEEPEQQAEPENDDPARPEENEPDGDEEAEEDTE